MILFGSLTRGRLLTPAIAALTLVACGGQASSSSQRAPMDDRPAATTIDGGPRRTVKPAAPDADPVTGESTSLASTEPHEDDGCFVPEPESLDPAEAPPVVSYAGQVTLLPPASSTTTTDPCSSPASTTTTSTSSTTTTLPAVLVVETLEADASFAPRSATLTPEAEHEIVTTIAAVPGTVVAIQLDAWTDDRGDAADNLALSADRAEAVRWAIISAWPDLEAVIDVVAHGETDPPDDCTGDCPANRVVVITIFGEDRR